MATSTRTRKTQPVETSVRVELRRGAQKVNSVVYKGMTADGTVISIYVPNGVLATLGGSLSSVTFSQ